VRLRYSFVLALCLVAPILIHMERSVNANQSTRTEMFACALPATPTAPLYATPRVGETASASPSPVSLEFDLLYLDLMITQQQRVSDMARLGAVKTQTHELQRLSEEIIAGTEPVLERLREVRAGSYDGAPSVTGPELMHGLDEIGRRQPGAGGVPGAMEIVAGDNIISDLCATTTVGFDQPYVDFLIEQLDAGIVLSGTVPDLAGRDETKAIASQIIDIDRPFEDGAIAIRDGILGGTPVASPASGGL
jgi:uncharacterized protein (DUF305 family)